MALFIRGPGQAPGGRWDPGGSRRVAGRRQSDGWHSAWIGTLEVPGRSLREPGRAGLAGLGCRLRSDSVAAWQIRQAVLSREAPVERRMTELGCRAWGRAARTDWRCRREGWRPGLGCLTWAPFWGVGGSGPGWRCRRSERVPAGWVDLGAGAIEPVPKRRAIGRTQHRRGPEESRQGRTARVAAWGLRHGGPGVRQSVIRTLEGGGGGRRREGGGGPEESNYVTPQQGLPRTDIAPPLTHRPARPALPPPRPPVRTVRPRHIGQTGAHCERT